MKKLWSGRFKEKTEKVVEKFTQSLSFDVRLWKYDIEGKMIPNRYTKNKEFQDNEEQVEMVVGTGTMRGRDWRDSFVIGYYTLGLYDDRLAFYILLYLKKIFAIPTSSPISRLRAKPRA